MKDATARLNDRPSETKAVFNFNLEPLRVVEGNYPMDFLTRKEQVFLTEDEAVKAAELFRQSVAA